MRRMYAEMRERGMGGLGHASSWRRAWQGVEGTKVCGVDRTRQWWGAGGTTGGL